ncbi:hypothetical protein [Bradyrhizobium sp. F1.4.3]|uniref:hypothetical protein n=1 Tax=Bradyrhizobium sp. F1.4.3 TaxID=3156356 RepID=UPI003396F565
MGSTGSEALDLLIAFVALAVIFYLILRNWHSITTGVVIVGIIGAGLGLAFLALVVVVTVGVAGYEGYKTEQCQTVHERVTRARTAPNDYFGNKLRTDADAEQSSCNEFAIRLAERAMNTRSDDFDPLDLIRKAVRGW